MAFDLEAVDHQIAAAEIHIIRFHRSGVKSHSDRERLRCGSRLIVITDTEVSPQSVQISGLILFRHQQYVLVGEIGVRRRVVSVQLGHTPQGRQVRRMIQVKKGRASHRQDLAAVDVHDNAADIIAAKPLVFEASVFIVVLLQILLDNTLNVRVQSEDKVVAVLSLDHGLFDIERVVKITVPSSDRSVESVVVILLKAAGTDIAGPRKTEDVARQLVMRIDPRIAALEPDAFYIAVYSLRGGNIRLLFRFNTFLNFFEVILPVLIAEILERNIVLRGGVIRNILPDPASVNAQFLQSVQSRLHIDILLQDRLRVHDHVIYQLAVSKHCSVAVYDLSPLKGYDLVCIGLL